MELFKGVYLEQRFLRLVCDVSLDLRSSQKRKEVGDATIAIKMGHIVDSSREEDGGDDGEDRTVTGRTQR